MRQSPAGTPRFITTHGRPTPGSDKSRLANLSARDGHGHVSWIPEAPHSPPSIDAFCGYELVRSVHELECVRPYSHDTPSANGGTPHRYSMSTSSVRSSGKYDSPAAAMHAAAHFDSSVKAQAAADAAAAEAADRIAAEARLAYQNMKSGTCRS